MGESGMGVSGSESSKVLRNIAEASRDQQWSVAIRLLSSLPALSSSTVLLCNRALCYSKLELYKHVVKDCDKALSLNPCTPQASLYKGQALAAMGKQQEALKVWQQGYDAGLGQLIDLQMLLQLHSLVTQTRVGTDKSSSGVPSILAQKDENVNVALKSTSAVSGIVDAKKEGKYERTESTHDFRKLTVGLLLARGISEVNSGRYDKAVEIFTQLIKEDQGATSAFIGRGTAYAFLRNLQAAIIDFSKAILLEPTNIEAWKRRGQARAAVTPSLEAVADLSKALELDPKSPETLNERGVVLYRLKDFQSAIDDLRACVALDPVNKFAYNYLGLALTAVGEYAEGLTAHYKALELDPSFKEGWTHLAQVYKELADSGKALQCLRKVLTTDVKCLGVWRMLAVGFHSHLEVGSSFSSRYVHAYRLLGLLLLSLGDHRGAVRELTTGLEMDPQNADCHYLRGSCHHAIGNYSEAVKDYDEVLQADLQSGEGRTVQSLAFYQKEIALYTASKTNTCFNNFDIDSDLDSFFKEAWCKRLSPMVLFPSYNRQPPLKEPIRNHPNTAEEVELTKSRKILLQTADKFGQLIQYNCPGFLRNVRQHRMAGLAVLEIAQKVATMLRVLEEAKKIQEMSLAERAQRTSERGRQETSQNRGGVCSSSTSISPPCSCHQEALLKNSQLKWRDVYAIAVRWRQLSEPCDPVVWVDKLSEKEFAAGFGSHTPMLLGQSKIVRYYPNFPRAFGMAKRIILDQRQVYNAENRPIDLSDPMQLLSIDSAADCRELYDVIGEDFWIVTPCHSAATRGKVLDGTRLTMQKLVFNGYDFSIRTPGTPSRWLDYDQELKAAWEDYCQAFCSRNTSSNGTKELQDCILKLSFYWYNFMPLARGTAVVGYITLLGLSLAADMEVTASIPEGVQVDWEAILSRDLPTFIQDVKRWLYPSVKLGTSWQTLPRVSETLPTLGSVVAALSSHYEVDHLNS